MEGIVSSDTSGLVDKGKDILKRYIARFGKEPVNLYEFGSSYDRPYIILNAIKAVGLDSEKIANYLRNMADFNGVVGRYHFDNNGDVVGVGFMSVMIKDGKEIPYTN